MILTGDALDVLKTLADNSADSLVTDPPAGIEFMGRKWDSDKGGRKQWVAWLTEILVEAMRVLKPGAHGLVWALPKTAHWTGWALEEAGFEVRDNIVDHINGQGMPKSLNVSKAIDKAAGAEREVVGEKVSPDGIPYSKRKKRFQTDSSMEEWKRPGDVNPRTEITAPATPEAEQWDGWGTGMKPSQEIWWLVRKPLSEKNIVANVLKWGVGAINIDAARIGTGDSLGGGAATKGLTLGTRHEGWERPWMGDEEARAKSVKSIKANVARAESRGRWPSNVIFSHIEGEPCPDCDGAGEQRGKHHPECHNEEHKIEGERREVCVCHPDCPVQDPEPLLVCMTCRGTGEVGGCRCYGSKRVDVPRGKHAKAYETDGNEIVGYGGGLKHLGRTVGYVDEDGKETVEDWECVPHCPVRQLDEQSIAGGMHGAGVAREKEVFGIYEASSYDMSGSRSMSRFGDSGGASRFFYCPKAWTNERYFLCRTCGGVYPRKQIRAHKKLKHDIFQHPTQKPLALMEYLIRLVTPPGGTVLDPFCGTGTTGVAAQGQGFDFVGIDMDEEAVQIATYRTSNDPEPPPAPLPRNEKPKKRTLLTMFKRKGTTK
jgi:DNA modification methylase